MYRKIRMWLLHFEYYYFERGKREPTIARTYYIVRWANVKIYRAERRVLRAVCMVRGHVWVAVWSNTSRYGTTRRCKRCNTYLKRAN